MLPLFKHKGHKEHKVLKTVIIPVISDKMITFVPLIPQK